MPKKSKKKPSSRARRTGEVAPHEQRSRPPEWCNDGHSVISL
ncbi:hypothetical protein ACH41H_37290 [Streptomyces sp. NPDC020800]